MNKVAPGSRGRGWGWSLGLGVLLVVLVGLVYGRVVTHGWLDYDDRFHVVDNPWLRPEMGLGGVKHLWRHPYGNLYIPVAYSAFWAEAQVARHTPDLSGGPAGQLSPAVFQAVKVGLHALCAVGVFGVLRRVRVPTVGAALGAAVWALHPVQAESVGWISETRGLLAGVFSIAAAWVYLAVTPVRERGGAEGADAARRPGLGAVLAGYTLATGLFGLALGSKPSAVTLPAMVVVLDLYRGRGLRATAAAMGPWVVMAGAALWVTRRLQPGAGVELGGEEPVPLWARPLIAGHSLAFYLGKLVWPFNMGPDYGMTPGAVMAGGNAWWAWAVPAAVGVGVLAWWWRTRGRDGGAARVARAALAGMALMGVALGPVLGLVTFDHQAISTVADRYMFMAMLGPALVVGVVAGAWPSPAVRGVLAALAVGLGVRAWAQVGTWRSDLDVWGHNVAAVPAAPTAHNNYGAALSKVGRFEEAAEEYREAVRLRPSYTQAAGNLATHLFERGKKDEAERVLRDLVDAAPRDPRSHAQYGALLRKTGRLREAREAYAKGVQVWPWDPEMRTRLGELCAQLGDRTSALEQYREALRVNRGYAPAWVGAGTVIQNMGGRLESADALPGGVTTPAGAYRAAVEADPGSAAAWVKLGEAELAQGRKAEAAAAFSRALEIEPGNEGAREGMGRAR